MIRVALALPVSGGGRRRLAVVTLPVIPSIGQRVRVSHLGETKDRTVEQVIWLLDDQDRAAIEIALS